MIIESNHDEINPDNDYVRNQLYAFNGKIVPIIYQPINLIAKNDSGAIIGGLLAQHYWDCMLIDILWVHEAYRNHGLGRALMVEIQDIARQRKIHLIHLDTHDFQAPLFYEKLGFVIFGILDDSPKGHRRYYFKKTFEYDD